MSIVHGDCGIDSLLHLIFRVAIASRSDVIERS